MRAVWYGNAQVSSIPKSGGRLGDQQLGRLMQGANIICLDSSSPRCTRWRATRRKRKADAMQQAGYPAPATNGAAETGVWQERVRQDARMKEPNGSAFKESNGTGIVFARRSDTNCVWHSCVWHDQKKATTPLHILWRQRSFRPLVSPLLALLVVHLCPLPLENAGPVNPGRSR